MKDPLEAKIVEALVKAISAELAGHPPEIQGVVLADLLAMFLVGHVGRDAPAAREKILRLHIATVRKLIPINEKAIGDRAKR